MILINIKSCMFLKIVINCKNSTIPPDIFAPNVTTLIRKMLFAIISKKFYVFCS